MRLRLSAFVIAFVIVVILGLAGYAVYAAVGGDAGSSRITNVADPIDNQDAATRAYVDDAVKHCALGTATVADIRVGETADIDCDNFAEVGTMPTRTLSADSETVLAGYYVATTLSTVDGDLAVGNIADGVDIFGFTGTLSAGGGHELPDTGQDTLCYNATTTMTCPTSGQAFYGQDSQYSPAARQPSYTNNGDGTITDDRTGLMWVQSGYANTTTTPATTYTADGNWRKYSWENALYYCERLNYATYTDWRLPDPKELQSIADYSTSQPAINTSFFTNTNPDSGYYWTSTTLASYAANAWYVSFYDGGVNSHDKDDSFNYSYVRPVRLGQ